MNLYFRKLEDIKKSLSPYKDIPFSEYEKYENEILDKVNEKEIFEPIIPVLFRHDTQYLNTLSSDLERVYKRLVIVDSMKISQVLIHIYISYHKENYKYLIFHHEFGKFSRLCYDSYLNICSDDKLTDLDVFSMKNHISESEGLDNFVIEFDGYFSENGFIKYKSSDVKIVKCLIESEFRKDKIVLFLKEYYDYLLPLYLSSLDISIYL